MRDDRRPSRSGTPTRTSIPRRTRPDTPQARSDAYRLAPSTTPISSCATSLRPVRLQLELLKPELLLTEFGVDSTVVLFGGARIPEPSQKHTARTETLAGLSTVL